MPAPSATLLPPLLIPYSTSQSAWRSSTLILLLMITVDHCLPPTINTLDPLQRQRLMKSTQKVGALLGATPRFIEQGMDIPQVLQPSTARASRRHGRVLYTQPSSASSSKTSLASDASDSYVWISASKPTLASDNLKHHKCSSTPITVHFPGKSSVSSVFHQTSTKAKTGSFIPTPQKPLSQPILYRMRSKPRPLPTVSPLTSPSHQASISPKPTFSSTSSTRRKGGLTESDKRRKMAKLVRTLGENIPPELVFGGASSATIPHPPPRSTSLRKRSSTTSVQSFAGRNNQRVRSKPDESNDVPIDSPIVFRVTKTVEECSSPISTLDPTSTPASSTSISASISPASFATITHSPSPKHRKHRPRSLTLGSIPSKPDQGNIIIEQGDEMAYTPRKNRSFDIPSSGSAYDIGDSATTASIEENKLDAIEYDGKRKEREWSGEWNVKDMREVTKALRGLRLR